MCEGFHWRHEPKGLARAAKKAAAKKPKLSRMKNVARWGFVILVWSVLIPLGACAAIMLPLNMVLVPLWLGAATSVGPLARKLFGEYPSAAANVARGAAGPADEGAMERALI